MNILCYRSPYLRRVLATNKKKNNNGLAHIKLSNIFPEVFQIILEYIYGGILSLDEHDTSDFLKALATADVLHLQELIDYLQKYLIESESEWIEKHFEFTYQLSLQSNNLLELQEYCTNLMVQFPDRIIESFEFTSLSEKSLISLIKRDDLQMKEIEVWEHVLKWGLAQNPTLISEPDIWTDDDFVTMKNTLRQCLPFVRFFCLSSKEFVQKVRPYKKLLNHQLYEDLVNSYMDPDSEPADNILLPRNKVTYEIIDSEIVNLNIISIISRWIDKVEFNYKFSHLRELYSPYKFELLLRGSRDGFTPSKFHELCDGKPNTITFIKIKDSQEIIGGYNPLKWESSYTWGETKDSFIFSFKNKNNFKDVIISNIENTKSFYFSPLRGPSFGSDDIFIYATNEFANYNTIYCIKSHYEKKIRDSQNRFSMEDYEIFQIIKRKV
ncbi:hypothetical protein GLOIN_2v1868421 [Rhizophagus clarus]|uniref:TLDc domain-containing protein n=1 Tax=Rhizophagus clarus TaxID=94130 RepID=A0A8H3LCE1_9GLOM|nr:hypothetical protein GLOIN_2v1868421 [Rhizophagus clarus]